LVNIVLYFCSPISMHETHLGITSTNFCTTGSSITGTRSTAK
jgi:hypothetical protein